LIDHGGTLVNNVGTISSANIGIEVDTLPAVDDQDFTTIINEAGATISGGAMAILGGEGVERIQNNGTLTGNVDLGPGDDNYTHDFQTATVSGTVDGGEGKDVFGINGTGTFDFPEWALNFETMGVGKDVTFLIEPGGGSQDLDLGVEIEGKVIHKSGTLVMDIGSDFVIKPEGTLEVQNGVIENKIFLSSPVPMINVFGSLIKSEGVGDNRVTINGNTHFGEGSKLDIQSGSLVFSGEPESSVFGGPINENSPLQIKGDSTLIVGNGSVVDFAHDIRVRANWNVSGEGGVVFRGDISFFPESAEFPDSELVFNLTGAGAIFDGSRIFHLGPASNRGKIVFRNGSPEEEIIDGGGHDTFTNQSSGMIRFERSGKISGTLVNLGDIEHRNSSITFLQHASAPIGESGLIPFRNSGTYTLLGPSMLEAEENVSSQGPKATFTTQGGHLIANNSGEEVAKLSMPIHASGTQKISVKETSGLNLTGGGTYVDTLKVSVEQNGVLNLTGGIHHFGGERPVTATVDGKGILAVHANTNLKIDQGSMVVNLEGDNNAAFILNGGIITGSGKLTNNKKFKWISGEIGISTFEHLYDNFDKMEILGNGFKQLNTVLSNKGQIEVDGNLAIGANGKISMMAKLDSILRVKGTISGPGAIEDTVGSTFIESIADGMANLDIAMNAWLDGVPTAFRAEKGSALNLSGPVTYIDKSGASFPLLENGKFTGNVTVKDQASLIVSGQGNITALGVQDKFFLYR
jgi:hypothetical protein